MSKYLAECFVARKSTQDVFGYIALPIEAGTAEEAVSLYRSRYQVADHPAATVVAAELDELAQLMCTDEVCQHGGDASQIWCINDLLRLVGNRLKLGHD